VTQVLILNGGGLPTLERCRTQYAGGDTHLGRLARPRHISKLRPTLAAGLKVGVDCDAFSDWNLDRFVAMIGQIERLRMRERWIAGLIPRREPGRPGDAPSVMVSDAPSRDRRRPVLWGAAASDSGSARRPRTPQLSFGSSRHALASAVLTPSTVHRCPGTADCRQAPLQPRRQDTRKPKLAPPQV
jgi:hypothetical protein